MKLRSLVVGVLILFCAATTVFAGTMLSPTAVLGTDLGTLDPVVTPLGNIVNQSSIDKPFKSGVTDFDTYFTTGAQPFGQAGSGEWWSNFSFNLPLMGFVDFDLGDVYSIDRIAIWNRSLENIDVLVSETLGGPMTSAGSFHLLNRLFNPFSYLPEIVELDDTFEARYMRFEINSTYKFDITDTFAYAIVGEVVVETVDLTADFDGDGDVDSDDLGDWQAAYSLTADGDADDDGDADGADFLTWQRQYTGAGSLAAITAVPEVGSLVQAMLGLLSLGTAFRIR